jgi:diguanylate cyclase (GGDEF)-like protein
MTSEFESATPSRLLDSVATATSTRDRDDLDLAIADLLRQFLGAYEIALYRILQDGEVTRLVRRAIVVAGASARADDSDDAQAAPLSASPPAWRECLARKQVVEYAGEASHWITLVPVLGVRDSAGLLYIEAQGRLPPREIELVHGILRICRNHIALLDYGELDTLTELLNRKTFESRFHKMLQRQSPAGAAAEDQDASWLALVDIDRFKSINDGFGHLFGDEVLLLVSQEMRRCFRGADLLFRYGGEEFVILLDRASEGGAQVALNRFRTAIESRTFPQVGQVTVSIGYTRMLAQDLAGKCVERADAALYYAKNHGRNNIRYFEDLVATGDLTVKSAKVDIEYF